MINERLERMSRRDRKELAKIARRRERLAKSDAKERAAKIRADGEAQLAAVFKANDARWAEAVKVADRHVMEANAAIDRHCEQAGVPLDFRPRVTLGWQPRGSNMDPSRRAELRRVLETRVTALEKQAITEIERRSLQIQTELVAGGLDSEAATAFLESMPTADSLMPGLAVGEFPEVAALVGDINTAEAGKPEHERHGTPRGRSGIDSETMSQ